MREGNLQRGMDQNLAMRLAAQLNWLRRIVMGFKEQVHSTTVFVKTTKHPEYEHMSEERKEQLAYLQHRFETIDKMLAQAKHDIEYFHTLPKYTPEHTKNIKDEKKARKILPKPPKPVESGQLLTRLSDYF